MDDKQMQEMIEAVGARVTSRLPEVMQEVYRRLPFGQEITLASGERCIIAPFFEPKKLPSDYKGPAAGELVCGFMVKAVDGSWDIGFYVMKEGWSGTP